MADINPKPEEVAHFVPHLREKFKTKYADKISKGSYDDRDIQRLNTDDAYARCFLRTLKARGDVSKACEVVHEAFKFRKEMGIWDLDESSFPAEVLDRKGMYYKGQDVDGHPILYISTKENTASGSDEILLLKKYIAWNFEVHHRKNPEQMCVVLTDMSGAGTGNLKLDITKFILQCFTTYFPAFIAYQLNYEMPALLNAAWKLITAFLNKDQAKKIVIAKKKDIAKYIPAEHLWEHMKA